MSGRPRLPPRPRLAFAPAAKGAQRRLLLNCPVFSSLLKTTTLQKTAQQIVYTILFVEKCHKKSMIDGKIKKTFHEGL